MIMTAVYMCRKGLRYSISNVHNVPINVTSVDSNIVIYSIARWIVWLRINILYEGKSLSTWEAVLNILLNESHTSALAIIG